jgi:glycerol-3-phosphate dehydrogenase
VSGLVVQDAISGQSYPVRAKAVVNATGVWADRLRSGVGGKPILRPLRGSHLVVPFWRLPVAQSISLMHPKDGRPVFLYPWEGVTLIGTTDLDHHGDLNVEASITQAEVDYLIQAVNDQFPGAALTPADISACYAGVRPVVGDAKGDASKAARDHAVLDESGLITLAGGKLTTFRLMAQDALALAAPHVGKSFARDDDAIFTQPTDLNPRWSALARHRLTARYGYRAQALCSDAGHADLQTIPGTNTLWLELSIAAKHEAVHFLDDLMLRRTRLGILLPRGGMEHLARIQELCEPHLQWGNAGWVTQIARYQALIAAHYQLPTAKPEVPTP